MGDPKHISDVLGKRDMRLVVSKPEKTSPVKKRLIEAAVKLATEGSEGILFQHSLLCQVSLPYRSQGKAKTWIRQCGKASFHMMSGSAYNPLDHTYVEMGLPYGVKPRVLLCHLNTEALLQGDPVIEVEDSMTAFARRLGIPTTGPHLLKLQKQIAYLGAARCQLSFADPENPRRSLNIKTDIISAYDVWFPKDGRQRVFWTSIIEFDPRYYASLAEHAVPTAMNSGANTGDRFCRLYGSHQPFSESTLANLYPTHREYVEKVSAATWANVEAGYVLPRDAAATEERATHSKIGALGE